MLEKWKLLVYIKDMKTLSGKNNTQISCVMLSRTAADSYIGITPPITLLKFI